MVCFQMTCFQVAKMFPSGINPKNQEKSFIVTLEQDKSGEKIKMAKMLLLRDDSTIIVEEIYSKQTILQKEVVVSIEADFGIILGKWIK